MGYGGFQWVNAKIVERDLLSGEFLYDHSSLDGIKIKADLKCFEEMQNEHVDLPLAP